MPHLQVSGPSDAERDDHMAQILRACERTADDVRKHMDKQDHVRRLQESMNQQRANAIRAQQLINPPAWRNDGEYFGPRKY